MKKIVVMSAESPPEVVGDDEFVVHRFDIRPYIDASLTYNIVDIDRLYRSGDARYHSMLERFLRLHADADVLIVNGINGFHPEWVHDNLQSTTRIWGCIDDPPASYQRTAACVWAYDGAFYVSPSYARGRSMAEALSLWGVTQTHWFPLSGNFWNPAGATFARAEAHRSRVLASLEHRTRDALYVGKLYGPKLDRLAEIRWALRHRFTVYGEWPLGGWSAYLGPLRGRKVLPQRVRALSHAEREDMYLSHRIGLNMHFSDQRETGNLRMYEVPYHGLMLLCDKAADGMHAQIFEPDREAVFYETTEEAIALIERYLEDDEARVRIARAGFERVWRDYHQGKCYLELLRWASRVVQKPRGSAMDLSR